MQLFFSFLVKILPLFLYVVVGFVLGRTLNVKKSDVATILIFFFLPFITFHGMYTIEPTWQALSLPLLFFIFCSLIAFLFLAIGKLFWKDNTPHLLAFASSYGNYAYFAIPAAIVLFGKEVENVIILAAVGFILFSSTVGYFIAALGNFTIKDSLMKTLKLPSIYTALCGYVLNVLGLKLGTFAGIDFQSIYNDVSRDMRGGLAVVGMMLLGLAIAEIKQFKADWKFIFWSSFAQFVVWPAVMIGFIILDRNVLHFYNAIYYQGLFLLSLIPIGINLIAYATQLDVQPEKAAFTILLNTAFAMVYIPLMITLFMNFLSM
jgi:predicted permease